MGTVANLAIGVSLRMDQLEQQNKKLQGKVRSMGKALELQKGSRGVERVTVKVRSMGSAVDGVKRRILGVSAALGGMMGAGIALNQAMNMETAQVQFSTLVGGMEKAKQHLASLREMAASTPFQFMDLVESSRVLIGMGISVDQVNGKLRMLGNVSAGSGMELNRLAQQYGEIRAKGVAFTQDLRQMITGGIPILKLLADHFGITENAVLEYAEQGKISFDAIDQALTNSQEVGGIYHDQMQAQSQTTAGRISTLKDKFLELMLAIGEKLKPVVDALIDQLMTAVDWVKNLDKDTVMLTAKIAAWAGGIIAAIVVVKKIIGVIRTMVTVYRSLAAAKAFVVALSGPAGLGMLAAGMAAAGAAVWGINAAFDEFDEKVDNSVKSSEKASAAAEKAAEVDKKVAKTVNTAGDSAAEAEKKLEALRKKGEALTQQMRTPQQVFTDRIGELNEMLDAGVISWTVYNQAVQKAMEALHKHNMEQAKKGMAEHKDVAAVKRGTVAAFSAGRKAQNQRQKQIQLANAQLASQNQTNNLLQQINTSVSTPPPVANIP